MFEVVEEELIEIEAEYASKILEAIRREDWAEVRRLEAEERGPSGASGCLTPSRLNLSLSRGRGLDGRGGKSDLGRMMMCSFRDPPAPSLRDYERMIEGERCRWCGAPLWGTVEHYPHAG